MVVSDIDAAGTELVAGSLAGATDAFAVVADVSREEQVQALVDRCVDRYGHVDLMCSNAGIFIAGGEEVSTPDWQRIWEINLMSHVYAARRHCPTCWLVAKATCSTPHRLPAC